MELVMRPRSVVGRREERPTVPGRLRANIAEVRLGKEALAEARDEFREQRVAPKYILKLLQKMSRTVFATLALPR